MVKNLLCHILLPSFEVVLFLLVFWTALFFMPDMLNSDGDLGRHITVGNDILNTRTLPPRDVFSHTRFGALLVLHEWLSEVVFAVAHRVAGLNDVAWLTALLLSATYFLLAVGLRALGVSAPIAFLAALAAYFTGMIHSSHARTFFHSCSSVFVLFHELYSHNHLLSLLGFAFPPRIFLALLPIVMILWTNFNGAFVWAFFVLAIYIAGALLDREPPTFPVQAVDFLERNPLQGNMFNEYTWGGYLEYRLFSSQRGFIDGNNDFFGEALVREYLDIINARLEWQ